MNGEYSLSTVVSYWDVDRDQCLTLSGVFKLLQEAAIKHADLFNLGAKAMVAHGESWVLNRMAARINRYPRYEEAVKVVTWSAGIRGFRGYRDLRLYCGEELVMSASTLWLYIDLDSKSLVRVPADLARQFPVGQAEMFHPEIDKLHFIAPSATAATQAISLRFSDFDGNGHMNNTAYLDCLQTALVRMGHGPRPTAIEIQFLKEIAPTCEAVQIGLEARDQGIAFALGTDTQQHAQGVVHYGHP